MPNYAYECQNPDCGHEFTAFQSMTERPFKKCPECKKYKLLRLIGAGSATILRGSWPGKDLKRKSEDDTLFTKAKVARRLKNSGKLPTDAVVHAKDIDLDKYHGPKKLPKNHPENIKPATRPKPKPESK